MKFLASVFAFIGSLFSKKQTVTAADPVETDKGTSQTSTVVTADPDVLDSDVDKAIRLVNNVEAALASPVAVLITDIIPGDIDNEIREELVNVLPVVAAGLTFVDGALTGSDKSTQLNAVLARIKFSDKPSLDAFYHGLAARVLMIVSGGKVSWSNAVMAVEYYFINIFKAPAASQAAVAAPAAVADEPAK